MATNKKLKAFAKSSGNSAMRDRNKALFAMLLWHATSNEVVSIDQPGPGTETTINEKKPLSLSSFGKKFGVLMTPAKFPATVAWLQNFITKTDSIDTYTVMDFDTGMPINARINVGVAFKIVAQTFNIFSRKTLLGEIDYDPNDNCAVADIIDIVPQLAVSALAKNVTPYAKILKTKAARKVVAKANKKAAKKSPTKTKK